MKIGYVIGGVLLGLFSLAQFLQLLGLIGVGFRIAGIGLTILPGVFSYLCFKKAFAPPNIQ
jgi:hypothetical protein